MIWDSEFRKVKGVTCRQVKPHLYNWRLPSLIVYQLNSRVGSITADGEELTRGRFDLGDAIRFTQGYEHAMWEIVRQAGRAQQAGEPVQPNGVFGHILNAIEKEARK